ncbi:hypothetical protein CRUP_019862 [Coryphaenoides rupestris]|nr:hypothetical protein CRUP_019862 [Coryphaenoides rupestris]
MTAGGLRISDRAPGSGALGREKDWNRVEDQEPRLPSVPGETLRTQEYLRRSLGFNARAVFFFLPLAAPLSPAALAALAPLALPLRWPAADWPGLAVVTVVQQLGGGEADAGGLEPGLELAEDQGLVAEHLVVQLRVGQDEGPHGLDAVAVAAGDLRGRDTALSVRLTVRGVQQLWDVLEPWEEDSGAASSSSRPRLPGELPERGLALEVVAGGLVCCPGPLSGASSSSSSEWTSWCVYWWISLNLRIICRLAVPQLGVLEAAVDFRGGASGWGAGLSQRVRGGENAWAFAGGGVLPSIWVREETGLSRYGSLFSSLRLKQGAWHHESLKAMGGSSVKLWQRLASLASVSPVEPERSLLFCDAGETPSDGSDCERRVRPSSCRSGSPGNREVSRGTGGSGGSVCRGVLLLYGRGRAWAGVLLSDEERGRDIVTGIVRRASKLNSGPMLLVVTLPSWPPDAWAMPLDRQGEEEGAAGGGEEALALLGKSCVRHMLLWVLMLLVLVLRGEAWSGVPGTSHDTSGEKPIWSGLWPTASQTEPGPPSQPPSPDLLAVGDVLGTGCGLIPVYCWWLCVQTGERGGEGPGGEGPGEAAGTASSSLESDRTISSGSWRPRGGSGEVG